MLSIIEASRTLQNILIIHTASSCKKPTWSVLERVADSLYRFDPGSASDPFTAHSLQHVSAQPALVVTQQVLHAYEPRHAYRHILQ